MSGASFHNLRILQDRSLALFDPSLMLRQRFRHFVPSSRISVAQGHEAKADATSRGSMINNEPQQVPGLAVQLSFANGAHMVTQRLHGAQVCWHGAAQQTFVCFTRREPRRLEPWSSVPIYCVYQVASGLVLLLIGAASQGEGQNALHDAWEIQTTRPSSFVQYDLEPSPFVSGIMLDGGMFWSF